MRAAVHLAGQCIEARQIGEPLLVLVPLVDHPHDAVRARRRCRRGRRTSARCPRARAGPDLTGNAQRILQLVRHAVAPIRGSRVHHRVEPRGPAFRIDILRERAPAADRRRVREWQHVAHVAAPDEFVASRCATRTAPRRPRREFGRNREDPARWAERSACDGIRLHGDVWRGLLPRLQSGWDTFATAAFCSPSAQNYADRTTAGTLRRQSFKLFENEWRKHAGYYLVSAAAPVRPARGLRRYRAKQGHVPLRYRKTAIPAGAMSEIHRTTGRPCPAPEQYPGPSWWDRRAFRHNAGRSFGSHLRRARIGKLGTPALRRLLAIRRQPAAIRPLSASLEAPRAPKERRPQSPAIRAVHPLPAWRLAPRTGRVSERMRQIQAHLATPSHPPTCRHRGTIGNGSRSAGCAIEGAGHPAMLSLEETR